MANPITRNDVYPLCQMQLDEARTAVAYVDNPANPQDKRELVTSTFLARWGMDCHDLLKMAEENKVTLNTLLDQSRLRR